MDRQRLYDLWERFGGGAILIIIGLVCLLFPGSAVALVTFGLALLLIAIGGVSAVRMLFFNHRELKDWFYTIGGLALGVYIFLDPMSLADSLGRFLGLFLLIQGMNSLRRSRTDGEKALGILTALAGIVLFLIPRTLVNTLLALVGLILLVIGAVNLIGARRAEKLDAPRDPNIIDAAE